MSNGPMTNGVRSWRIGHWCFGHYNWSSHSRNLLNESHHHRDSFLTHRKKLTKLLLGLLQFGFLFSTRVTDLCELRLEFVRGRIGIDCLLQRLRLRARGAAESARTATESSGATRTAGAWTGACTIRAAIRGRSKTAATGTARTTGRTETGAAQRATSVHDVGES